MDFKDQLKNLFPDHVESNEPEETKEQEHVLYVQKEPMICKFEKRKGKATTIIEGYEGSDEDFKLLAKEIKTKLSVGGTFKDDNGERIDFIKNLYKCFLENILCFHYSSGIATTHTQKSTFIEVIKGCLGSRVVSLTTKN